MFSVIFWIFFLKIKFLNLRDLWNCFFLILKFKTHVQNKPLSILIYIEKAFKEIREGNFLDTYENLAQKTLFSYENAHSIGNRLVLTKMLFNFRHIFQFNEVKILSYSSCTSCSSILLIMNLFKFWTIIIDEIVI